MFDGLFTDVSHYVTRLLSSVINLFTDERTGPFFAGVLLCAGLFVLAYVVFRSVRALHALNKSIRIIGYASGKTEEDKHRAFLVEFERISQELHKVPQLSHAWREFRETLIVPNAGAENAVISNSTRPHNFFTLSTLKMGLPLARHLPNIFVGIGLLGTFLGLIAALTAAIGTFTAGADSLSAQKSISTLLTTASAKFYVSAAALFVSIILTLVIRFLLSVLSRRIARFNGDLEERLTFATAENIAGQQLAVMKEQATQLQTFNTDLAMTIGRSVREAVSESNEALMGRLDAIATNFTQMVEASRVGAGDAVTRAIDNTVTQTLRETTAAIKNVADGLTTLPARLEAASSSLVKAGKAATESQEQLAKNLQERMKITLSETADAVASQMKNGTAEAIERLAQSGNSMSSGAAALSGMLADFSDGKSKFLTAMREISQEQATLQQKVGGVADEIMRSANELKVATTGLSSHVSDVLRAIGEIRTLTTHASEASREAQKAISTNVQSLTAQWERHVKRFDEVDEKLAHTFGEMSNQIKTQTDEMRTQVQKMDSALAKAVAQFEAALDEMGADLAIRRSGT